MKYIRTKYGIFETISENDYSFVVKFDKGSWETLVLYKDKVIKESNNLEELCDEAVFFDKDNKPHYKSQEGNIWYLGAGLFTETLRFGVFTDKGLFYVAKMNNEGELELL